MIGIKSRNRNTEDPVFGRQHSDLLTVQGAVQERLAKRINAGKLIAVARALLKLQERGRRSGLSGLSPDERAWLPRGL